MRSRYGWSDGWDECLTPLIIDGMRALAMLAMKVGSSKKKYGESGRGLPEFGSLMEAFLSPCLDLNSCKDEWSKKTGDVGCVKELSQASVQFFVCKLWICCWLSEAVKARHCYIEATFMKCNWIFKKENYDRTKLNKFSWKAKNSSQVKRRGIEKFYLDVRISISNERWVNCNAGISTSKIRDKYLKTRDWQTAKQLCQPQTIKIVNT